jgi:dTDP-4-dehydrorhamnose 3,5-epimerase
MKVTELTMSGVKIIEPDLCEDDLGWTAEIYSAKAFERHGIKSDWIQENYGYAFKSGCFRGIHFQNSPHTQAYLIRCIRGALLDFAVDLRPDSPTYKKWVSVILSAENRKQIWLPRGVGHACLSMTDHCVFEMKVDQYYEPSAFRVISYLDPEIKMTLPITDVMMSENDRKAPFLCACGTNLCDSDAHRADPLSHDSAQSIKNDLRVSKLSLDGVQLIEPKYYDDSRGFFVEAFSAWKLRAYEIDAAFVWNTHDFTRSKHTLRGIYFQNFPHAQGKLVGCTRGAAIHYAIDLRQDSPQFRRWANTVLSVENHKQLWIPKGFAHAYLTLTDNCELQCKYDDLNCPEYQRVIRYDDPEINIDWRSAAITLSEEDARAPFLKDVDSTSSTEAIL